ncbi:MAG: acetylxylan esterase [Anaerocolumna sp.]
MDENRVYEQRIAGWALTIVCAFLKQRMNKLATVYPFLSDYQSVREMVLI